MTQSQPSTGGVPRRSIFSSEQLPPGLSEHARRSLWRDIYGEIYGPLEVVYAEQQPFHAHFAFNRFGSLGLADCVSTIERFNRTRRCVAASGSDSLQLAFNRGRSPMLLEQDGRQHWLPPGQIGLVADDRAGAFGAGADNRWIFVTLPRKPLLERIAGADDLVARPLDPQQPAMRLLRGYLGLLVDPEGAKWDAQLDEHVAQTLLELVALALGAAGDAAETARLSGQRAARLRSVQAAMRAGFRDPAFSIHQLAAQVGLSPRGIQDLLQQTGSSFTERLLELRLQEARTMLSDRQFAGRRIIDIAYACGFGEVSHFNRMFRRRFGAAPSDLRG